MKELTTNTGGELTKVRAPTTERRYLVIQANARTLGGAEHGLLKDRIIRDGLTWKGKGWWHDGGNHMSGVCVEVEQNVEVEVPVSRDFRTAVVPALCDCIYVSYDVERPGDSVDVEARDNGNLIPGAETLPRIES